MYDRIDPGGQTEGLVLRHKDLRANDIALHDCEHERAADRISLHESAYVDIALNDDAVERRYDTLVGLLLVEHQICARCAATLASATPTAASWAFKVWTSMVPC